MNWKKAAEEDLRKYTAQKQSLVNIQRRISALQDRSSAIKSGISDRTPVQGGMSQIEDRLLDNIVERERLKHTYRAAKKMVDIVELGLAGLDVDERLVLDRFYINHQKRHVERLMDEWHVEQARVYQIKDRALYKFTIIMYGIIDY